MRRLLPLSLLVFCCFAGAGNSDVIPTCYNGKMPAQNSVPDTELFLVVDQTTLFNDALKQSIADNVRNLLKSGIAFSVIQFSAFTQGHYTNVLVSGKLDPELVKSARDDISKPVLNKFDQCMAAQPSLAGQLIGGAMRSAFGDSSDDIAKSDIFASLKDISGKVRQSPAKNKIVLLASDMLENSSITSFYSRQAARQIIPEKEIKLVADNQLFGDFGGARIYVIGAGLLAEDAKRSKGIYRPPQTMQALSRFWTGYFQKSNAELVEFGRPALLNSVQ
ncbi:MAG: hypothetical protein RLZZ298_1979 [Pseudomonadota bacterium]|jgi:hypothetical protein